MLLFSSPCNEDRRGFPPQSPPPADPPECAFPVFCPSLQEIRPQSRQSCSPCSATTLGDAATRATAFGSSKQLLVIVSVSSDVPGSTAPPCGVITAAAPWRSCDRTRKSEFSFS